MAQTRTAQRTERADVAGLVASRLCHDLVSPIGAIGNGVELLGMTGVHGAEMDLIAQSVEGANARIRFYRIAFGLAREAQTVDAATLAAILESPHRGTKARATLDASGPVPREEARLAFLLIMCTEAALLQGGDLRAVKHGTDWRIDGRGTGLKADPLLWSVLTGGAGAEPTSATVQFALAADCAARLGAPLSVDMAPERITIHARMDASARP